MESGDEEAEGGRGRRETNDIINVGWRPAHQANEGQARSGFVISRLPSNMSGADQVTTVSS